MSAEQERYEELMERFAARNARNYLIYGQKRAEPAPTRVEERSRLYYVIERAMEEPVKKVRLVRQPRKRNVLV